MHYMALAAALGLAAASPLAAQGYGPVVAPVQHYQMYRGDALDIDIGKDFSWAESDSEAVAAFMRADNKLRLVAIKPGTALITLTQEDKIVWKAEVVVR
jgi:hypothetical protein